MHKPIASVQVSINSVGDLLQIMEHLSVRYRGTRVVVATVPEGWSSITALTLWDTRDFSEEDECFDFRDEESPLAFVLHAGHYPPHMCENPPEFITRNEWN